MHLQHRRYDFFAPAVHMYVLCGSPLSCGLAAGCELELELILSQMAQKPMLRGEVGARALRVRSDVRCKCLAFTYRDFRAINPQN